MNRREFLQQSAAGLGGAALVSRVDAQPSNPKMARIAISTWSFHNFFSTTRDDNAPAISGPPWDARDFPDMIADHYHVHEMEIVAPHISTQASYIRDLKARLERAHSHLVNIPVDIHELEQGTGLSDRDAKLRDKIIAACTKWIDVAHELGARSVRCDPGKINTADLGPTVDS